MSYFFNFNASKIKCYCIKYCFCRSHEHRLILFIVGYGVIKKVKVYEVFVEGAKDGLKICKNIFPYLLCMLLAIKVFIAYDYRYNTS